MTASIFHAFLDESGNSGRNYLDFAQPFYVLGGWAVAADKVDSCRRQLARWEAQLATRGGEVKAASVLKRKDGLSRSLELLEALVDAGAVPTCCVFEKRFGISMNLTETFFPGEPVTSSGRLPIPDARSRSATAEILYRVISDELLIRFARAIYDRDIDAFAEVRDELRDELLAAGAVLPAAQIASVPVDLLADFPFAGSNAVNSINATVFHSQLMLLEHLCRLRSRGSWELFHDEIPSFEEVLRFTLDQSAALPDKVFKQSNGMTLYLGKLRLRELRFVRSDDEALIRCADHYVGFMNSFFKSLLSNRPIDVPARKSVRALLNSTVIGLPPMQFLTLSPELHKRLAALAR